MLHEYPEEDIIACAKAIIANRMAPGRKLAKPADVVDELQILIGTEKSEKFGVIYLDNRHRLITHDILFHGTIDGCFVHPREVVRRAIETNAAAVILFHNHPSGVAEPSSADEVITNRLKGALKLIDVTVLDHLVVTGESSVSFASRGLI